MSENSYQESKRVRIEQSKSYTLIKKIATVMDKYMLDGVIGLVPIVGDFISSLAIVPFLYVSIVKVRSIPLTLAIIFNYLVDILVGIVPWIGNIADFLFRANLQSFKLISGFVENDRAMVGKVNRRAAIMAFLICIVILTIVIICKFISFTLSQIF